VILALSLSVAVCVMPLAGMPVVKADMFSSFGDGGVDVESVAARDDIGQNQVTDAFEQDEQVTDGFEQDGWQSERTVTEEQSTLLAQADIPSWVPQSPTPPVIPQSLTPAGSEDLTTTVAGQPALDAGVVARRTTPDESRSDQPPSDVRVDVGKTTPDKSTSDQPGGVHTDRRPLKDRGPTLGRKPRETPGSGLRGAIAQIDQDILSLDETSTKREYSEQLTQIRGQGPSGAVYGLLLRLLSPAPEGPWGMYGLLRAVTGLVPSTRYAKSNDLQPRDQIARSCCP